MSEHEIEEYKNTGLGYCLKCGKAEVELQNPCIPKQTKLLTDSEGKK